MRLLYIDIDTLRADHLGCYGYHRNTSPNMDALAKQSVRFEGCYTSDSPCLPSRTALLTGRFGIHNGVVGHGGTAADPVLDGPGRSFSSSIGRDSWPARLRRAGLNTMTISSFAERHSAFHWYAGFNSHDMVPKRGLENGDEVCDLALDWLGRNGGDDDWFLHVHLWDPHTPYRVPAAYGDPFAGDPLPAWLTEEVRQAHWSRPGPHSAQECVGFSDDYPWGDYPRQPKRIDHMDAVRQMFDGYDTGVRFADDQVGRLINQLSDLGVLDDTAIMLSADHGETLGELNIYCDHHTADEHTNRLPMLLKWPGKSPRVDGGLCYQIDVAATLLELLGQQVPDSWDGQSFKTQFEQGQDAPGERLILSHGAWTCQRAVRFEHYLALHSVHDGYHALPQWLLFDLAADPHEQHDLSQARPELIGQAKGWLHSWHQQMLASNGGRPDPFETVVAEGGPSHVRGQLAGYLERLRNTDRAKWVEHLMAAHPDEL